MKESELYEPIKRFLERIGYDVFAEVQLGVPGKWNARADVIGYMSPASCIVEMKTSLSLELIEQAYGWLPYANYIYVAVPRRKKKIPTIITKTLHAHGIGVLEVDTRSNRCYIHSRARFNRPRHKIDYKSKLLPEHKTWAEGGTNGGGYVTPYKLTIAGVKQLLSRNPHRWFSMKEILDHCETHYANPKNSLSKALRDFENEWCEAKVISRKLHFRMRGR